LEILPVRSLLECRIGRVKWDVVVSETKNKIYIDDKIYGYKYVVYDTSAPTVPVSLPKNRKKPAICVDRDKQKRKKLSKKEICHRLQILENVFLWSGAALGFILLLVTSMNLAQCMMAGGCVTFFSVVIGDKRKKISREINNTNPQPEKMDFLYENALKELDKEFPGVKID